MLKLKLMKEPDGSTHLARAVLEQLCASPCAPEALRGVTPAQVDLGLHHWIFDLAAKDATDTRRGLSHARVNGYCKLIRCGRGKDVRVIAAMEFDADPNGSQPPRFRLLNVGPFVTGLVAAIGVADVTRELGKHEYELRLLRLSGLHPSGLLQMAVWLHSANEARLIPLQSGSPWLPMSPVTWKQFADGIKPFAIDASKKIASVREVLFKRDST
jgi:hypothetical protein